MLMEGLDHPKTLHLASLLDVSLPTVIGHLELLWAFTGKKAAQGNIGKWPDGAIARACFWMGNPQSFLQSLLQSGFIDAHPEHRYVIHDWQDHAPRWVRGKLAKAKLSFVTPVVATVVRSTDETSEGGGDEPESNDETVEPTVVATTEASLSSSVAKPSTSQDLSQSERANVGNVSRESSEDVTNIPRQSAGDATGEGNGRQLTPEAAMSIPLRERNVKVTSMHPLLVGWVKDGYTVEQLLRALAIAQSTLGEGADTAAKYLDKVLRDPGNADQINGKTAGPAVAAKPESPAERERRQLRDEGATYGFRAPRDGEKSDDYRAALKAHNRAKEGAALAQMESFLAGRAAS